MRVCVGGGAAVLSGRHFVVSFVVSHFWPKPVLVKLLGMRENMENLVCRKRWSWSKKAIQRVLSNDSFCVFENVRPLASNIVKPWCG